ncbi:MAG: GlsB/YeaQ/YmgE family stress response membrane protein [Candidatus Zhuqueibacterota bacterium]
MSILGFFILLIVASICGSIGAALAGRKGLGCFTSIVLGLIGALIGTWLSRELGVHDLLVIHRIPILWSIVGSAVFVALITALSGNMRTSRK